MVYKIIFEYLGDGFYGLERQKNLPTIAGELEKVLNKLFAGEQKVVYASRTDKGVSALMQVASFKSNKIFTPDNLKYKLNRLLPSQIKIKNIEIVNNDFCANKNVAQKTYKYSLFLSSTLYPIEGQFCTLCYNNLNIRAIKKAAKHFVGTHNFSAFCSADCEKENKVRTIYKFKVEYKKICENNIKYKRVNFYITGNGFLQHMVRIMVGTLVDVGIGKLKPQNIPELLKFTTRTHTTSTLSSKGLMLMNIKYK